MTPQERQLVDDLFDRLAKLESNPRDPDAENAIADGWDKAPNAAYALVQSVLVQEEALKRANERIQQLETQLGNSNPPPSGGSFLESARQAAQSSSAGSRGSVPSVHASAASEEPAAPPATPASKWNTGGAAASWNANQGDPQYGNTPPQQPWGGGYAPSYGGGYPPAYGGGGGSFLGTAASAAAGVVGGALLMGGIRSLFGHSAHAQGAFDPGLSGNTGSWAGSAADSDLARDAGLNDIGRPGNDQAAGLFDAGNADSATEFGDAGDFDSGDMGGGDITDV